MKGIENSDYNSADKKNQMYLIENEFLGVNNKNTFGDENDY